MELRGGIEPPNSGFADHSLSPLGTGAVGAGDGTRTHKAFAPAWKAGPMPLGTHPQCFASEIAVSSEPRSNTVFAVLTPIIRDLWDVSHTHRCVSVRSWQFRHQLCGGLSKAPLPLPAGGFPPETEFSFGHEAWRCNADPCLQSLARDADNYDRNLAGYTGFEPVVSALTTRRGLHSPNSPKTYGVRRSQPSALLVPETTRRSRGARAHELRRSD